MPTTASEFDAEEYLAAAQEHLTALNELLEPPERYALAYYVAGLAVECVFRAYTDLVGGQHDPKHDLRRHAEAGRFIEFMPEQQKEEVRAALGEVVTRWRNNHRYKSEAAIRRYLNGEGLYRLPNNRTIKGDVVKHNIEPLVNGATLIVTLGVGRWENSRKKWKRF